MPKGLSSKSDFIRYFAIREFPLLSKVLLIESIRRKFEVLEGLRNEINPVRVLHAAVKMTNLAETGPLQPMISEISGSEAARVEKAAMDLFNQEEKNSEF